MQQRMMFNTLLVTLGVVMLVAFGGLLQSQEQQPPWVGNVYLKLQKLSKTDDPVKGQTFNVEVKVQSVAANGHVKFTLSGVSDWEGHAMNAGTESDTDPDSNC